jgi:hypothetical protein
MMTKFNQFLISIGFNNLMSKTTEALEEMLNKIYAFCEAKYGPVLEAFFTESWQPNKNIKRGVTAGLDVHHKPEYDPANPEVCSLSDPATAKDWYEKGYTHYQLPHNLVYCNWIEHQAIHAIIDILRMRQFGAYRPGCIELRRAGVLNRYFNEGDDYLQTMESNEAFKSRAYFIKALSICEDELETYQLIMDEWAMAVGIECWFTFGQTLESIENCFETYVED